MRLLLSLILTGLVKDEGILRETVQIFRGVLSVCVLSTWLFCIFFLPIHLAPLSLSTVLYPNDVAPCMIDGQVTDEPCFTLAWIRPIVFLSKRTVSEVLGVLFSCCDSFASGICSWFHANTAATTYICLELNISCANISILCAQIYGW